jgi:hypothetical protein
MNAITEGAQAEQEMYEQTAEGKWEKQQAALEKTRKKMEEEE